MRLAYDETGVFVPCITVPCQAGIVDILEELSLWSSQGLVALSLCLCLAAAALWQCQCADHTYTCRVPSLLLATIGLSTCLHVAVELHPSTRDCFGARSGRTSSCWDTDAAPCDFAGSRWLFLSACTRGTGVSLFDYADFAALTADELVVLCLHYPDRSYEPTVAHFKARFPGHVYELGRAKNSSSVQQMLERLVVTHRLSHVYAQVHGSPALDNQVASALIGARTRLRLALGIHAVFVNAPPYPHPVVNARISYSVSGTSPVVPYMARPRPRGHTATYALG